MTSEPPHGNDPRRKRALFIGGAIVLAAIGWNIDDWTGNDSPVHITVNGNGDEVARAVSEEVRDNVRDRVREEVRASIRGDHEADSGAAADEDSAENADTTTETGERRLVESESGDNQRTFRIEGDDGRGVTISVDADSSN